MSTLSHPHGIIHLLVNLAISILVLLLWLVVIAPPVI